MTTFKSCTPKEIEELGLIFTIVQFPDVRGREIPDQLRIRGVNIPSVQSNFDTFPLNLKEFDIDLFRKFFEKPLFDFKRVEIIEMVLSNPFENYLDDLVFDFYKIMKSFNLEEQIKFILDHMKLFIDIVNDFPLEIKWTLLVASLNTQKYS